MQREHLPRWIVATLLAVLLISCSVRQPRGAVELPANGDEAMIVFSTRVNDTCGGVVMLMLGVDALQGNRLSHVPIQLVNSFLKKDFSDPPVMFYTLKFKAGDLRFTKITRTGTKAGFQSEREINIQMHVEPGKVYYLGELYVDLNCGSFSLRVNDQRQRDGALFDQRMTTLSSSLFEHRLLGAR